VSYKNSADIRRVSDHRQSRWLEFMSGSKPHGPSGK
jgi:hypothetical protein